MNRMFWYLRILCLWVAMMAAASSAGYSDGSHPSGIRIDGTLGNAGAINLQGPTYDIKANYGKQAGSNLFHSFQQFNLHAGETAVFSGPDSVRNIISRVTGGSASWIDGKLASTIPHANLYFLNPAGVMFGPNALLDISGSFHVSTADYLRMGDHDQFDAAPQAGEVLSIAEPSAFGFIDNSIAPITLQGRGEISEADWNAAPSGLHVAEGKTVSLIGGDINITKGTFYQTQQKDADGKPVMDNNGKPVMETVHPAEIKAPDGRIILAGIASSGDISVSSDKVSYPSGVSGSNITVSDNARLDVSGAGGGSVCIRGGTFVLDNGDIYAQTLGENNGRLVDIQADTVSLINGNDINCNTYGKGNGADVTIRASDMFQFIGTATNADASAIYTETYSTQGGKGGSVSIAAKTVKITDNATIYTITYGNGDGGDIVIKTGESLDTHVAVFSQKVAQTSTGNSGSLLMEGQTMDLYGLFVQSVAFGKGNGGDISIKAVESIRLRGGITTLLSAIAVNGEGNGGSILIEAPKIVITDDIFVNASTYGKGPGGNVTLNASELTLSCSILANTAGLDDQAGAGGQIRITAQNLSLSKGAVIGATSSRSARGGDIFIQSDTITLSGVKLFDRTVSKIYTSALGTKDNAGNAGNIDIQTNRLVIKDGGQIAAGTNGAGNAGAITLTASEIELIGVNPSGENSEGFASGIYTASNRREGIAGNAGDIVINADSLLLTDGAAITNSTSGNGAGGEVTLTVRDTITISGDSSGTVLNPAGTSQMNFMAQTSPTPHNYSVSGVYSKSEGTQAGAGNGGRIHITAQTLKIADNGKISTSSAGSGRAGDLQIKVNRIETDSHASIVSESQSANIYDAADRQEQQNRFVIFGDVLEISNMGDGRMGRYICAGTSLLKITPVYQAANLSELETLSSKYAVVNGDLVKVADAGDGNPAMYIYSTVTTFQQTFEKWIKIRNADPVIVSDLSNLKMWFSIESEKRPPYPSGTLIKLTNARTGKSELYVYSAEIVRPDFYSVWSDAIRLNYFEVADSAALNGLSSTVVLKEGDMATVAGSANRMIYLNGQWRTVSTVHKLADFKSLDDLNVVHAGDILNIKDAGSGNPASVVYSGKEWIGLGQRLSVADMAARDALTASNGDMITVADSGSGTPASYLFLNGSWIQIAEGGSAGTIGITSDDMLLEGQSRISTSSSGKGAAGDITIKTSRLKIDTDAQISSSSESPETGGDAGVMVINADDTIQVMGNGTLTTEAKNAGGGQISINADHSIYLFNGNISASVSNGQGKGGDVTVHSDYVVLNHSRVIANAEAGDGGAIFIETDNYLKSEDSTVSATSKRGNNGTVKIQAPDLNLSGSLMILPSNFMDVTQWIKTPCAARSTKDVSQFIIRRKDASSLLFDDWQPLIDCLHCDDHD